MHAVDQLNLVFMFESVYLARLGAKRQANWEKPQTSRF